MASKTKEFIKVGLKIAIAAALVTFMVKSGHLDLKGLWQLMTPMNIALALTLCGLNVAMAAWRWILLLKARGFQIGFGYGFSLYLIGLFFNHALPGAVGGDLIRGYYLVVDNPERKVDSVLSIIIDRVLGLYSFFLLSLIAVAFDFQFVIANEKIRLVALLCFIIFVGLTILFTITFSKRLTKASGLHFFMSRISALNKLVEAFQRFGRDRKVIAASVLVSVLAQLITMLFFYQVGIVTGETGMTWKAVMFAVPMGFVVTAVPISPAGIGVGQVAFHYLFQIYLDKPTSVGSMAITAFQLCLAAWALLGAFFYLRRGKPRELSAVGAAMESSAS